MQNGHSQIQTMPNFLIFQLKFKYWSRRSNSSFSFLFANLLGSRALPPQCYKCIANAEWPYSQNIGCWKSQFLPLRSNTEIKGHIRIHFTFLLIFCTIFLLPGCNCIRICRITQRQKFKKPELGIFALHILPRGQKFQIPISYVFAYGLSAYSYAIVAL